MLRYAITIFLSAFLLFQVQPMIARFILPWFGGTAGVWTTCMMFFQITLLLGYAYAHVLRASCSPRAAWLVHVILLGAAACFAQIIPPISLQPDGDENLTVAILTVLTLTIGLPFFVLSTTGPLIQAWQSTSHPSRSPYRLYALSNLGSMLALLTYPFLFERYLPLEQQARIWSIGFLAFAFLSCWSGLQSIRSQHWAGDRINPNPGDNADSTKADLNTQSGITPDEPSVGWLLPVVWILLAMAASVMLLATTNLMCQEVASVPFLWILPLSLYLLSFIICFDRPGIYKRKIFTPLLVLSVFVSVALVHLNVLAGLLLQIVGLSAVCFAASMTCHGELERLKPSPKHLTLFYLFVAGGGSLGGIFVAVVAPHLFTSFLEFHFALLISLLVPLAIMYRELLNGKISKSLAWSMGGVTMVAATFVLCSLLYFLDPSYHPETIYLGRNEYGLVGVEEHVINEDSTYRIFVNGRIQHGGQFTDDERAFRHSTYYVPGSGVSVAFESMRAYRKAEDKPGGLNVGILGLGAGGMMTWAEPADRFVFYEINPLVEKVAREYFTYISDGVADTEIVLGDGRIQLQRRAKQDLPKFDLLFMDAFASDSIPIHLITEECFDVYCQNLTDDGILIAHITNRFVDLRPVVYQAAIDHGLTPILIDYESSSKTTQTRWVLMTKNEQIIESETIASYQNQWPSDLQPVRWTDDYTSLAALLDWSGEIDWKKLNQINESRRKRK